jgi:hypothetical protein
MLESIVLMCKGATYGDVNSVKTYPTEVIYRNYPAALIPKGKRR